MPSEIDVASRLESAVEALAFLRLTLRDLRAEIESVRSAPPAMVDLAPLRAIVEAVGQDRPARPVTCPDEYVQQWRDFVAGRRAAPEARGIRYLCWEPDVANTAEFRGYLSKGSVDLRARSIQGLVRCCHMRWGRALIGKGGAIEFVRAQLDAYGGPNRVLGRWRANQKVVFSPEEFAQEMLAAGRSPHEQSVHWSVDAQSAFLATAMGLAANEIRARPSLKAEQLRGVIFWDGWELSQFKDQVAKTLVLRDIEKRAPIEELKALILSDPRLRDPRLPANQTNWVGISTEARDVFIRWLSADDIEFFFQRVLPRGRDPHGRKPFWLRYVKQVQRSRPLLCWEDEYRLRKDDERLRAESGSFGRIDGNTSAFLLDFGTVLVIEFSRPGHACYCYDKRAAASVIPEFWSAEPFRLYKLKQKTGVGQDGPIRIIHRADWEDGAADVLGHFRIRVR